MSSSKMKVADITSMCLMAVSSIMIITAVAVDYESLHRSVKVLSYIASVLFWVSLIAAWIIKLILYKNIKQKDSSGGKPAVITFFSNRFAIIADVSSAILLIALIITAAVKAPVIIVLIIISLFIFAFQMHIALNGRVYKYIYC